MSDLSTYTFDIRPDRTIETPGVHFGAVPLLEDVRVEPGASGPAYLAVRLPGRKSWSGLGRPWIYVPAEIRFYLVVEVQSWHFTQEHGQVGHGVLRVQELLSIPVRSGSR